ncbi:MAG: hypothetical protein QG646_4096 [Euryarchaeota archaeon]|nr:hypothetical protein [Euryarchaeota archaeon]
MWNHLDVRAYSAYMFAKEKLSKYLMFSFVKFNTSKKNIESFSCPICNYHGPFLNVRRRQEVCPKCSSVERHRLQFLVLQQLSLNYDISQMSILHIAPEPFFKRIFEKKFLQYVATDISRKKNIDCQADLLNLPFKSKIFDCVFASHVLEHIQDDEKAIAEIKRILKPGGIAILPVPIVSKKTIEYPAPNPYESEHVRAPGLDYFDKYRRYFKEVIVFDSKNFPEECQLYIYENRTKYPNKKAPLREPVEGEKHDDFVPVCLA